MSDAVWDAYDALVSPRAAPPPWRAMPARLPAAEAIPPREWLYGTRLVRGFVSVLAAPGGVGKSALALGQAVCLAAGRPLLGERVHAPAGAWVMNLEDPGAELDRRVAAFLRRHALPAEAVAGRLFLHSGRDRRLCMAAPLPGGALVHHPDRDAVAAAAQAAGVGLIVVDPFVKSHALDENSNPHMDAAATAWAEVADAAGCAVLLVHHVRKGTAGAAPDADAARGAKALTDAARSAGVLAAMTPEEADSLGVPAAERWRHVRLDDAKSNMAPRAAEARWFRLDGVALGNGNASYPRGDVVAAIAPWRPETAWERLDPLRCNQALDLIAAGPRRGVRFAANRRGRGNERWAGAVLVERFGLSEGQAAEVIRAWLGSGLLLDDAYRCPEQRKERFGVRVVDALRPTIPHHGDPA